MKAFSIALFIFIFLMTVTLHELSHGVVAYAFGDRTAKDMGRLTLNPLKHIDPLWTVLLPMVLLFLGLPAIGMAKPVPVNFQNLRNPKQDMIWVAAAGPVANIFLASLLVFFYKLSGGYVILLYCVYFNLGLAIFNLLPIPPLDGSRILVGLLPPELGILVWRMEIYGFVLVLVLFYLGWLTNLIIPAINFFCQIYNIPVLQLK